ncbi:MAG: protoporphyrinogen oxidase [Mycobacteriales bacterium]
MTRVVVVGGGITGLAAAYRLATTRGGPDVLLLEAGDRLGGKLRTTPFLGRPVDEGAEAFLTRVPAATELARAVGLPVHHPVAGAPAVLVGGRLRPLPPATLLGVPTRAAGLVGVLGPVGLLRAGLDLVLPRTDLGPDPAVGALVGRRLGRRVVDRLVDPLLGGVYAGRSEELSTAATAPMLLTGARSLILGARGSGPTTAGPPAPVFGTVPGGLGALVEALVADLRGRGVDIRTGSPASRLRRTGTRWQVSDRRADAVLLAVPAPALAELLVEFLPDAAGRLPPYASVALVTLGYAAAGALLPPGSGFLVPAGESRAVKAVTFLRQKWGWPDGPQVLRASVGRYRDRSRLAHDDIELAGLVTAELAALLHLSDRPLASRVSRWPDALPQYLPGHLARVAALRAALPAGLAVAGAAVDGVGIAACVRSGQAAADQLLATLANRVGD